MGIQEKRQQLEQKIADVYYYLLLLSYETGIDIQKVFQRKMEINEKKYPIEKARGSSKKYSEL